MDHQVEVVAKVWRDFRGMERDCFICGCENRDAGAVEKFMRDYGFKGSDES